MASNLMIGSSITNADDAPPLRAHYKDEWANFSGGGGGVCEIEEEEMSSESSAFNMSGDNGEYKIPLATIREEVEGRLSTSSFNFAERGDDVVYVAVGKQLGDDVSMDALSWAVKNAVVDKSSCVVFLVHVFPETKYIPTPLGNLPISKVNPEQKELYMAQERGKRRDFLQKFLKVCSSSQVKADTILIESEMEAKAILDLIPILNMRKLVLGATKSTIRRMRSKKGNGVADQILQGAPEFCEVKIICEGKEMSELMNDSPSSSPSPRATADPSPRFGRGQEQAGFDSAACGCFKI